MNNHDQNVDVLLPNQLDDDYIRRHGLVLKYITGRLAPKLNDAFEQYYLDRPELIEEIRFEKALREGLTAHQNELGEASPVSPRRRWLGIAAAMALPVFAVSNGWAVSELSKVRTQVAVLSKTIERTRLPLRTVGAVLLETRRGTAQFDVELPPPGAARPVYLTVPTPGAFDVRIQNEGGEIFWQATELIADSRRQLEFILTNQALTPGQYRIVAAPANGENSPPGNSIEHFLNIR